MLLDSYDITIVINNKNRRSNRNGRRHKITVSPWAFFNKIKKTIMYDKSIPLIYTQSTVKNNINNFGETWEIEKYCKNKNNY